MSSRSAGDGAASSLFPHSSELYSLLTFPALFDRPALFQLAGSLPLQCVHLGAIQMQPKVHGGYSLPAQLPLATCWWYPANHHEPNHVATHPENLTNPGARLSRPISRSVKYHLFCKQEPGRYREEKARLLGDVQELRKVQMAIECFST